MKLPFPADPSSGTVRCLVIQLARLGDTLQSLMALRAAKELYPQIEISFLTRESFSIAAKRVPWIHQVYTLPADQLVGPVLKGHKDETQALQDLTQWLLPLLEKPWDMIINWSFSEASSYLTSLLPGRIKLGYTRRKDSTFAAADGWSHYVQGVVQQKVPQDIHLTDILTTQFLTALQIHIGDPAANGESTVTSKYFFSLSLKQSEMDKLSKDPTKRWLGIQLNNSPRTHHCTHHWDTKNWASLIEKILTNFPEYGIYLLGTEEEAPLEQALLQELSPKIKSSKAFISLVGKTDFDLWASTISTCQWLFSANSSAVHLGAILGTRIIHISLGQSSFSETGPYGNGHYIISSKTALSNQVEINQPSMTAVYSAWTYGNSEWRHLRKLSVDDHLQLLRLPELSQDTQIFRSQIRQSGDGGGVRYEPLLPKPLELHTWTALVVGHMARAWYCGWVPEIGKELIRGSITPPLVKKLRELQESTDVLSRVYEKAYQTALSLKSKTLHLKSEKLMGIQDREELQQLGATLIELDELTERIAKLQPPFQCFQEMSKVLMHHLSGTHLGEISQEAANSYQQLKEGVGIFKEWVQFTLNLAKPVAIKLKAQAEVLRLPEPTL